MKENNTWIIRRLVNETIDPATQRIILKIVGFFLFHSQNIVKEHMVLVFLVNGVNMKHHLNQLRLLRSSSHWKLIQNKTIGLLYSTQPEKFPYIPVHAGKISLKPRYCPQCW